MSTNASKTDFSASRARTQGVLVAILMALIAFSFLWYFVSPASSITMVEADTAEVEQIIDQDPFYVLLIGSDSRKGTALYTGNPREEGQTSAAADVLTLVRVDPRERILTFLTVPRDTLSLASTKKISAWLNNGDPARTIFEVEKLTGVDIPYYVVVSFMGFEDIIDALGGVVVDVPTDVSMLDPATGREVRVSAGPEQKLNGASALAVSSSWDLSEEMEALRQVCVRSVERAIIDAIAEGDEEFVRRMVTVFNSSVNTNLEDSLLVSLALDYAQHTESYTVYMGSGPYQGKRTSQNVWCIERDAETWQRCMEAVEAGEDPNTVVVSLASNTN